MKNDKAMYEEFSKFFEKVSCFIQFGLGFIGSRIILASRDVLTGIHFTKKA